MAVATNPEERRADLILPFMVLLRMGFTRQVRLRTAGELLPHLSTLTCFGQAVIFCCTFLRVASTGRYPASLPYGARTFLREKISAIARFTRT